MNDKKATKNKERVQTRVGLMNRLPVNSVFFLILFLFPSPSLLMRRIFLVFIFFGTASKFPVFAQDGDSISAGMLKKMVSFLASDQMGGRVNYSVQQLAAARFINDELGHYGLKTYSGNADYFLPFRPMQATTKNSRLTWNGKILNEGSFYFLTSSARKRELDLKDMVVLRADLPLADSLLLNNLHHRDHLLIWVNLPAGMSFFEAASNLILPEEKPLKDILVAGSAEEPQQVAFNGFASKSEPYLFNIAGVLPGKSKADEIIIFSAHYDHVSTDIMGRGGEIFNGANDNASGTAAVLALARYYALKNDNERTLVFCLIAGEELGLYGSADFASGIDPARVKLNINIEMIGYSNISNGSFFLTGPGLSSLQDIFTHNLEGPGIKLMKPRADPDNLFQRSDNYSFFLRGIPAHSIMCSDDNDPCYHKPCDDPERIDYEKMATIVKGIIKGAYTIVSGKDTPVLKK
jgi:hypothetical protein